MLENDEPENATGPDGQLFSVNRLARELGITPRTLRFYETKGLITPRRMGSTRVFDRRDRARMMLILRGKRLGFSLAEIGEYLELYVADPNHKSQTVLLLGRTRQRIAELEAQQRDLEQTLGELRDVERQALAALGLTQTHQGNEEGQTP